jgi:hypothetical protein
LKRLSLSGLWQFRFESERDWRTITVPGCWEALGIPKDIPGPALYRRIVEIPRELHGERVWLRFDGVSYDCTAFVNGAEVGRHTGLWDAFRFEITDAVMPGEAAELLVWVEKPASLRLGPASQPVPGSFSLKETLAGFLPYVWGHIFGGLWQDVSLEVTESAFFHDACVRGTSEGRVRAEISLSKEAVVRLDLYDPDGTLVLSREGRGRELVFEELEHPLLWSPDRPALYRAVLTVEGGETRVLKFGFRSLRTEGTTLLLNGRPLYPRMALSWGWYPESLHGNPGKERVREDLLRLRELGYNGVKLCLWVPPEYYFKLADELGMLLWLELPMWLPEVTDFFRKQTPLEYERIVRQVRGHPSLILYTLGCELSREVSADFLGPLYAKVKGLIGDALLRDNSGSGEAYGGLLNEFAEFYDYHFYSDIQFFRPLVEYFSPRWRPEQPWIFGEFCDLDTFRDLRKVYAAQSALRSGYGGEKPWWTLNDEVLNPQGARWQYDVVAQEDRLKANGFWERSEEIEAVSNRQALLHRKFTLELVRTYREISGYVITGERDTPISTAGMWDDLENAKFDAGAFRAFNQDIVLALGWDKRRAWLAGGDRAAYWDTFSYPSGATVRAHLIASHYGRSRAPARLGWRVELPDETILAEGEVETSPLEPGTVRELTIAEFAVPEVDEPVQASLQATVEIGEEGSENSWPLWFFPPDPWQEVESFSLLDPLRRLVGLEDLAPIGPDGNGVVATCWTQELEDHVQHGSSAILLLASKEPSGPFITRPMPFWREAVKVLEPHPAWGDFPHEGWVNLQFFGLATDHALDVHSGARPILRRLDARTMEVHDYAAETAFGNGRLIVSTLRFDGSLGEQPLGIKRNTAAAYLLSRWVRYLQQG